jgi:hypothetical protein
MRVYEDLLGRALALSGGVSVAVWEVADPLPDFASLKGWIAEHSESLGESKKALDC